MLIAYLCISKSSMTDSMNFGPEWLRNLSSEGSTGGSGTRYQLADYRYGREEMLALFEKGLRAPLSLSSFNPLYSEQVLQPLALFPQADDERSWVGRPAPPGSSIRGRGTASLDRGGRGGRGRGAYQNYRGGYDGSAGWTGSEAINEWSPRKDYTRATSVDNWRRHRGGDDEDAWRNNHNRVPPEKWVRSASWRDGGDGSEEKVGPEKPNRASWQEGSRGPPYQRPLDDDRLPEWATENSVESGSFDSTGAFHGCPDDEQREQKATKNDVPLQKSTSQQNIMVKSHPKTLPTSHSAISLTKPPDDNVLNDVKQESPKKFRKVIEEKPQILPEQISKPSEPEIEPPKVQSIAHKEQSQHKQHFHNNRVYTNENNIDLNGIHSPDSINRVDEEFERIQEDFVKKLVVDEEMPKKVVDNFMLSTVVPPPNLAPPSQDNWYYQDPQGDLQGPFPSSEMAEWFRAGYFTSALLVKRLCDEAFYRLGDLVTTCSGNPFQSSVRIAPLKPDISPPGTEDILKYQLLQRHLLRQAENMRVMNPNEPPWVMPQQRDLVPQQVLTHSQLTPSDMQFFQQQQHAVQPQPVTNPLMNMINQMQQANKLPGQILGKKPPAQLDPLQALVQQMGGLQSLSNTNPSSSSLPTNIPTNLQNSGLLNNYANLPTSINNGTVPVGFTGLNSGGLHNPGILPTNDSLNSNGLNMNVGLGVGLNDSNRLPPRPNPLGAVDSLTSTAETDPLKNLLQQLQTKTTQQLDSLWPQNQYTTQQTNTQWPSNETPMTMWDLQPQLPVATANSASVEKQPPSAQSPQQTQQNKLQEKELKTRQRQLKENLEKEQKRQKELEEKQAKKEAEERRKEEQRKQEAEKKAAEEKHRKEEERIRKEVEKAKKEAEEKRLRELEEKRRLKEQRKAEEEARRKMEEQKKLDDVDRIKKEKEEQIRIKQIEALALRQERELAAKSAQRMVPWSQPNNTPELSLADIQRAEREKRAEQVALSQQQRAQQAFQQEQTEKTSMQLSWTKKLQDNKSIKSFAEIQQEEQERFTKHTLELRAASKEREAMLPPSVAPATPWSGQGLAWANSNQWNNNIAGFWDDVTLQPQPSKHALFKSSSAPAVKQVVKQNKHKLKKDEQQVLKLFSNGPVTDEFTEWCITTLKGFHSTVDIPTFINFLRDIESALEVKDYCKEYFGDVPATQQFVTQFLEKRRMFKPKVISQTDDMSSPAPAITPSVQHNTDFQEVKGKGKKTKKSKMIKVDARNLGFSVTAAPDRINVGDRDFVEN